MVAWFSTDSAGSVASGNPSNVAFNLLVLVFAVGPLWRPAKPCSSADLDRPEPSATPPR
jgi:hypothetical protein